MLIWVCALHCEAKPVIDYYRLKKSQEDYPFDVYRNDTMICVISGHGKLASASATAWIGALQPAETTACWMNLGTAGTAEHALGMPFQLNQIEDADTGQRYYPVIPEKTSVAGHAGLCLSQPSTDYVEDYLFDMESSGFIQAAVRFSSAELIRSVKVVSDNRYEQIGRNRQAVSDLIQQNITAIDAQSQALQELGQQITRLEIAPEDWQAIVSLTHFTATQRNRLRVLLRYLLNRRFAVNALVDQLRPLKTATAMLGSLEQLGHQDSEQL